MYTSTTLLASYDANTVTPRTMREHPVVVVPGFMACDLSTSLLRAFLRYSGYDAVPWGFGRNVGPVDGLMERFVERLNAIALAAGDRVTLVGHSLGGIYAREAAKVAPDVVKTVFTLGSPIRALAHADTSANGAMVRLIERAIGRSVTDLRSQGLFEDLAAPPPVRCVALYSRRDTVAPWQSCLELPSRLAENVEVSTTHKRMIVSPAVFRAIVERLETPGCVVGFEDVVTATAPLVA